MDTQLSPVLDPGLGSRLKYKYSVTQLSPGGYLYVNWWDGGQIVRAEPRQKDESGNTRVAHISRKPMFPNFPLFLVPRLSPLLGFACMTVLRQRGTINTGYA